MNLSLKQLKVFLGIADASSFTRTAQSMHLSQAALSAIIRELETQLQCRLFDRTTRTVALTEAGRRFFPIASGVVDMLEKSAAELCELGRKEQTSLSIGCTPIIAASVMPATLQRFAAEYPAAQITLIDRTPDELQRIVKQGDLDAAFGAFFSALSGIDRLPIFPTQLMAVSSLDDDRLGPHGGGKLDWHALSALPLICLPKENPLQHLIDASLAREEVVPSKRIAVAHLQTAIAMADAGLGVAIVPSFCEQSYRHYRVRADLLRPVVEFSFYRIVRAGRGDLSMLERFTEIFGLTTQGDRLEARR